MNLNYKIPTFYAFAFGFISLMAQSKFDVKKKNDVQQPKPNIKIIEKDGRKTEKSVLRIKPKGEIQNKLNQLYTAKTQNKKFARISIETNAESKLPEFIKTIVKYGSSTLGTNFDKTLACKKYIKDLYEETGIEAFNGTFESIATLEDPTGESHIRLKQKHKGFEIYGAEVIVHLDKNGNGKIFNGKLHSVTPKNILKANINSEAAIGVVVEDLKIKTNYIEIPEEHKALLAYNGPELDTIIYKTGLLNYCLAYRIHVRPNLIEHWEYIVNANTGAIINSLKTTCHADGPRTAQARDLNNVTRTIDTYLTGSTYYLKNGAKSMFNTSTQNGAIITYDAKNTFGKNFKTYNITSTNNTWSDPKSVSAHYNASVAYDYYKNNFNRNSIDGQGGTIYSIINVAEDDGTAMDNAYWNGKAMYYGNGKDAFKPLAGGLDVGGHEMTHGVVQNTANLQYQGESGAINEAMADIFGCMMDSSNWLMGEDVVNTLYFPSGALRSLSDPHNGGKSLIDNGFQPKHMNEKFKGTEDNGGVHINSGIINYAFYLLATSINSRKDASKVFYRALSTYLTQSSSFYDLRVAAIQSATDIFGASSSIVTKTGMAFDQVGITTQTASTASKPEQLLTINPGTEYILEYNTDSKYPNDGLGILNSNGTGYKRLNKLGTVYNKPSVVDDGSFAVFVGNDKKMYAILTDPTYSNFGTQTLLQSDTVWSSVAVSKDGSKIAAVTSEKDTSIYIFDLNSDKVARFALYNPTFSNGVKSDGPVYADGLDWDYSGENIVYDCFNAVTNADGTSLEYWDINIINVWNNSKNDFSGGDIFKLITNLEPGESIGNPSFSKNSPNIIAFDYENTFNDTDDNNDYYAEIGVNLETNDLDLIVENNYLGWPSYGKNDDKLIYTAINTASSVSGYVINYVPLASSKITSNGNEINLLVDCKWGIYFSNGTRDINVGINDQNVSNNLQVFPNPTNQFLNLTSDISISKIEISDKLGRLIYLVNGLIDLKIDVSNLANDMYFVKIVDENNKVYTTKFTKN